MSLPRIVRAWVRLAVPAEFAQDLLDDLEDGYTKRRAANGGARRWLLRELVRTPYLRLVSQARRMRAAGTRREMPSSSGVGSPGWIAGLKVAARSLARRPGYTSVAVLTLTASIGSATVIFSVLEGVLLRPLPYEGSERIQRIFAMNESWRGAEQEVLRQSWDRLDLTEDMIEALRGAIPDAEALGAYAKMTVRLDDDLDPTQLQGAFVLPGFFETLKLAPLVGRLPSDAEIRDGEAVVMLSERIWSSRYGRDPSVVGRAVSLDGKSNTVIGVLPRAFAVPELADWWSPPPPDFAEGRTDAAIFSGLVRLAPGTDPAAVTQAVARVGAGIAASNAAYEGMGVRLQPLSELLVDQVKGGIGLLFWAVVVVVLIASVNLANLVVARGARRRPELAMRTALGASRAELVWAMLSETVLLCVAGGGAGVIVATQLLDPFMALMVRATPSFPRVGDVAVNGAVLAFSAGVALLTTLLSGLLPALAASRRSPWEAMKEDRRSRGGRATRRTQRSLLLVETALAMVLLGVAGLLTRSAMYVARIDPGYDSRAIAYLRVETADAYPTAEEANALGDALEARLRRLPGTRSVARAMSLPGLGNADGRLIWPVDGTVEDARLTWVSTVSPAYFETLGIPVVSGRTFTADEGPDDPKVVVVNERFARMYFGEEDPVGKSVMMGTNTRLEGGRVVSDDAVEITVVGVVADVRQLAVVMEPDAGIYLPIAQGSGSRPVFALRTAGDPAEILDAARAEIHAEDPGLLVSEADVLHTSMRRLLGALDVRMILIVSLAGLASFLTIVGIYGVVAYVVSDQVHEIGIRMALGARSGGESKRMVLQAMTPVAVGALLGLGGAYAASALVKGGLFGIEQLDPLSYAAALATLLGVAALAAWLPARRAASVDPMRMLTEE